MDDIYRYINMRYLRWLDYANFHAAQASLRDQAGDLLHTVLESLLGKDPEQLRRLFEKKKQGYTELDFFVLRMIKLNAHSATSPYRHKNCKLPRDANVDPLRLDILDEDPDEEEEDYNERILRLMRRSREILDGLDIPQADKDIFSWKFFGDNTLRSWPGHESYTSVCLVYHKVLDEMKAAISPERYRIQLFCRNFLKVRSKLLNAA